MTPFFSIIVPTYNSASTLQHAINSIISQTFVSYEFVFIDGRSTDETLNIISDLRNARDGQQVKYLTEPDKGIYDAMNKGIGSATGEWLYFMGSDDILSSNEILSVVHQEIKKERVDLIYGNAYGLTSKKRYVYDTVSKVLSEGIHHQSIFYKTSVFNAIGKYDLKFKVAADYHLTLKIFFNSAFKTKYIDLDIAGCGENGLSANIYDYEFFSYHYKLLALNGAVDKIDDQAKCLDTSVYCCLYLAKEKKDMLFAWRNLWYYLTNSNYLGVTLRIKTFLRMLFWSLRPGKSILSHPN